MLLQIFSRSAGRRMRRLLCRAPAFADDQRGATAVEFGIVGIPFFMILCAIFEAAFLVFNQGNLEHATYEASRQLLTGSIQSNGNTNAQQLTQFSNLVCSRLWANFNCGNLLVDVQSAADFNGALNTSKDIFSGGASNGFVPGASGNVVIVRVGYPYPLYFNRFGGFNGGTANIMAVAVFKAENY
jgi:Flp pilus assembly protein TadG